MNRDELFVLARIVNGLEQETHRRLTADAIEVLYDFVRRGLVKAAGVAFGETGPAAMEQTGLAAALDMVGWQQAQPDRFEIDRVREEMNRSLAQLWAQFPSSEAPLAIDGERYSDNHLGGDEALTLLRTGICPLWPFCE